MDSAQAKIWVNSLLNTKIGGWHINAFIGKGKSAVVLACTQADRNAAIKVFHPELIERYGEATQLERIRRETSLVGESHPNLVSILDGGKCPLSGYLYVVMERIMYSNLHDVLQKVPVEAIPCLISLNRPGFSGG